MKERIFACTLLLNVSVYASSESDYIGSCFPKDVSVTQSFVIDNVTNEAFGQNLRRTSRNSENFSAVISIYPSVGGDMNYKRSTLPNDKIGHQGLSIQYINGVRYFWGSMSKNSEMTSGNYSVRYQINSETIENIVNFKLFSEAKTVQSTSPAVSYDQKYLIARMTKKLSHEIRVFDLKDFISPGDFSGKYKHVFFVKRDQPAKALQAIASDGRRIFLLMGSMNVGEGNSIEIFSLSGERLGSVDVHQGEEDARNTDSGTHYEPEGLTWLDSKNGKELIVQIATGDIGKRKCKIYKTGIY